MIQANKSKCSKKGTQCFEGDTFPTGFRKISLHMRYLVSWENDRVSFLFFPVFCTLEHGKHWPGGRYFQWWVGQRCAGVRWHMGYFPEVSCNWGAGGMRRNLDLPMSVMKFLLNSTYECSGGCCVPGKLVYTGNMNSFPLVQIISKCSISVYVCVWKPTCTQNYLFLV